MYLLLFSHPMHQVGNKSEGVDEMKPSFSIETLAAHLNSLPPSPKPVKVPRCVIQWAGKPVVHRMPWFESIDMTKPGNSIKNGMWTGD